MMRAYSCIPWLVLAAAAMAQDGGMTPPQPQIDIDRPEKYQCHEKELSYEPVASYRVSGLCEITDIGAVGDYQYGIGQVKAEIPGFQSSRTVKRFVHGESVYRKEVRIELHKALEPTATLVCETDMMERRVFDARIIRSRVNDDGEPVEYEEPVELDDHRLPDLGTFTYSRKVTTKTDRCEDD